VSYVFIHISHASFYSPGRHVFNPEMRVALFGNPLKMTSELLSLLHVSSIGDQRRSTDNDFIAKYAHSSVLQGTNPTYIHTHPLINSKSCT
jgi:hypothetical protein